MIPNWYLEIIRIGPIPIHVWGLFVALGFIVGITLAVRSAARRGMNPKDVADFGTWVIFASIVGARMVHVLAYEPTYYLAHPLAVLRIWEGGLSSFGGFLGALLAAVWFVRRRKISFVRFSDALLIPFTFGWFIGRLGCYSTHLHPGIPCTGFLCVPFPDGTRRLDMGLLDGLLALAIGLLALALRRQLRIEGHTTAFVIGCYGVGRFFLDFLRVGDATYAGFTPAQYGSIILVVVSSVLILRAKRTTSA